MPGRGRPEKPLPAPVNAKQRFGAQLRQLRHLKGFSVGEMAEAAGCSATTIGQAERGQHLPSETLVQVWDAALDANNLLNAHYEDLRYEQREQKRHSSDRLPAATAPTYPLLGDRTEWVADITIPDGTLLLPGQTFTKVWRIRNAGTVDWTERYLKRIGALGGVGQISTPRLTPIPDTPAGHEVSIAVACKAHVLAGSSVAHFKMADQHGHLYFPTSNPAGIVLSITVLET
ncbi:helix-turn-helix domain-containing protein [Nocardia sp. NBC_01388]|uniref:helix-turn-helix domain-containing protein n=1 Tax=Nocardia sp. NBC_01388 TaxID=2903596 RepID=UPI00325290BF